MDRIPDWMQVGVVFKWSRPEATDCHYKITAVSTNRAEFQVIVVKASTNDESNRPLGFTRELTNRNCVSSLPIPVHTTNYKKDKISFTRTFS